MNGSANGQWLNQDSFKDFNLQLIEEQKVKVLASGHMFSKAADHKVNVAENEEGIWRENAVTY